MSAVINLFASILQLTVILFVALNVTVAFVSGDIGNNGLPNSGK